MIGSLSQSLAARKSRTLVDVDAGDVALDVIQKTVEEILIRSESNLKCFAIWVRVLVNADVHLLAIVIIVGTVRAPALQAALLVPFSPFQKMR